MYSKYITMVNRYMCSRFKNDTIMLTLRDLNHSFRGGISGNWNTVLLHWKEPRNRESFNWLNQHDLEGWYLWLRLLLNALYLPLFKSNNLSILIRTTCWLRPGQIFFKRTYLVSKINRVVQKIDKWCTRDNKCRFGIWTAIFFSDIFYPTWPGPYKNLSDIYYYF